MKKIFPIAVIIVLAFFAFGLFQSGENNKGERDKKTVLTTFTVLADMTSHVAGDVVHVASLTKPGANIHSYEPTPSDLIRAQEADLILDNGLNLELWADKLYQSIPSIPHVTLTDAIEPISISEGSYAGKANPHAWMSPKNALLYVDAIEQALTDLDPEHAEIFQKNAETYKKEIRAIDAELERIFSSLDPDKRALVTCEGAFSYLTNDYQLEEIYMWPINSDANGTPQQIASVVDKVREKNIPAVFCESTVSSKPMEQVAEETGSLFGGTFYVDSLTDTDGPASTYLDLLKYNAELLATYMK